MRITKADYEAAVAAAYTHGKNEGFAAGRKAEASALNQQRIDAVLKLINAVGTTLDSQARVVQGLASALDNIGGIR